MAALALNTSVCFVYVDNDGIVAQCIHVVDVIVRCVTIECHHGEETQWKEKKI